MRLPTTLALSFSLSLALVACSTAAEHAGRPADAPRGESASASVAASAASRADSALRRAERPEKPEQREQREQRERPERPAAREAGEVAERPERGAPRDTIRPAKVATIRLDSVPAIVRALYVNRWTAQSRKRMRHMIAIADRTEINGLVLDMKDEFGLNYSTASPAFAKNAGHAGVVPRLDELLDTLHAHKLVAIARIVVFKDSVTARIHPEWTIRQQDGSIWRDKKGIAWVNPYHRELWEYNIGVAEELVRLGFDEIQFDYIRFPEPYPSLPKQVFPGADVSKPEALARYLAEAKKRINALHARSTADIFGLVTTVPGALEVGQEWEKISPNVDVVLPMVYPSHYPRGAFGIAYPNADPYATIKAALAGARRRDDRLGIAPLGHVRPWLQAFSLGKPQYGAAQLREEKRAVYDSGYDGWVMWSPGSHYDVFVPALDSTFVRRAR